MRHSPRAMYPQTALLTAFLDRVLRRPVQQRSVEEIVADRGKVTPDRPPFSWVTGAVDRSVGITFGTAPARDGYEIPLRIYRPRALRDRDTDAPVVVFLHGGGFVEGNVVMYDPLCSHLASRVRAVVVSLDYRLAPEHRAPTAAHDCLDATTWLQQHGDVLHADTSRMALCGDSAGGNLAAVTAQLLRDRGDSPVRHQALIYPATDMTLASPSMDENADAPMLTRASVVAFREHYLPPGHDHTDPLVSPLFGRLDGLPPALVQTADLDPLRDDGVRYAAALEAAGVPVRLTNYVRVPHGFASIPGAVPTSAQHRAELVEELVSHLYGDRSGDPSQPADGEVPLAAPAG
ncbi:alpha/beta hydrolase [Phycicoccus sp. Soil748]|uniref:alpha/beta hydrolase n=1 Tax=Phycicoccus sp. Soil748 TaxID=1736397 RepID=UPI0007034C3B|nr:alpha/beta hydrolase [Phycicoccus sp. Soil748]KRE52706.1 lipase [Phycicoccus sp. Soil748]